MSQAVISEGLLGHCHELEALLQAPALRGHWHSEMVTQKTITAPQPLPELQFNIFFSFSSSSKMLLKLGIVTLFGFFPHSNCT